MLNAILLLEETASSTLDFSTIISALTGAVTPVQILTMLASVIAAGMAFFVMWVGVRKLVSVFTKAVSGRGIRV